MATGLRADFRGGNIVYYDTHRMRVVDAIGPDVIKYELLPEHLQYAGGTGTDPIGWTTTVVEVGAGTTEFATSASAGILGRITCAANENDGGNYQQFSNDFEFTSNQTLVYAGVELAINDVDQTDILFGLCVTDTTLLGGVADGVYLESLDGAATVSGVTEKDSTETQTDSIGTLTDATFSTLEFYFDGTSVYFFVDGTQSSTIHTTNIPDDVVLRPSIHFLTGEAVANTCDIRWMRFIQVGRT